MALGILGSSPRRRPLGALTPHIDMGPECAPGFPCSEAAEQRQIMERGLTAFLDRARSPRSPMDTRPDALLSQYQEAYQQLSPGYRDELNQQAATIATMRAGALERRQNLVMDSAGLRKGLHGPYYVVPSPGPFLIDAARAGTPYRRDRQNRLFMS